MRTLSCLGHDSNEMKHERTFNILKGIRKSEHLVPNQKFVGYILILKLEQNAAIYYENFYLKETGIAKIQRWNHVGTCSTEVSQMCPTEVMSTCLTPQTKCTLSARHMSGIEAFAAMYEETKTTSSNIHKASTIILQCVNGIQHDWTHEQVFILNNRKLLT